MIRSKPTNDNYRSNFDAIFCKPTLWGRIKAFFRRF